MSCLTKIRQGAGPGHWIRPLTAVLLLLVLHASSAVARGHGERPDLNGDELDGRIIDSIEIDNRNVYDTNHKEYDNFLFRTANRLHVVTRDHVIGRELLFAVGDPFSVELAEEIARNLRARYELYDAWVETEILDNDHLLVRIVTIDLWSFIARLNLDREGDVTEYRLGIEERNLLGNNLFVSGDYFFQSDDDNYFQSIYRDTRFFGKPFQVQAVYSNNPTNRVKRLSVGHPFYNLNQTFAAEFSFAETGGRNDVYRDNRRIAKSETDGETATLLVSYRQGEYKRKLGLNLQYDYVFEDTHDRVLFDTTLNTPEGIASIGFPSDSAFHQVRLGVSLQNYDFATAKRIRGFSYTEDFTLGQLIKFDLGRAFKPGFSDHLYDRAEFSGSNQSKFGPNLVNLSYRRVLWFRDSDSFRRISSLSVRWYNYHYDFVTLATRALYVSDWRDDGSNVIVLGGDSGLRGYNTYFLTGQRRMVFNLEGRFFSGLELLTVKFGGALFADVGQIWDADEPVKFRDFQSSIGAGLRISFEKSTKGEVLRVDLAYGQDDTWQLSVGTGQYF